MVMLFFSYSKAEVLEGKVVKVLDGNTFELEVDDDGIYTIMLWGVDCPEINQPYSKEATALLENLILKKKVTVKIKGKDRKGIRLGEVYRKKKIINHIMLQSGLGWADPIYSKGAYNDLEATIKESKIGIWQEVNPTPPWIFRRQQTMKMAKGR